MKDQPLNEQAIQNEILRQLDARKSVRAYDLSRPVATEVKEQLLDAAVAAPTAGCMSLYAVLDITDPALKEELSVLCDNQPFIATAPVVFIFLADWQRWYDSFALVTEGQARKPAEGDLFLATADAVIAAQNVVVAAEALSLGSCYIGDVLERQEEIATLFGIPQFAMPVAMLCIGYPTEQQMAREKPTRFAKSHLVHENIYRVADGETLRAMFEERSLGRDFAKEVAAMQKRKWDSEFRAEMNRSTRAWVKRWLGD